MTNSKIFLEWKGYYSYTLDKVNLYTPYNKAGVYKIGVKQVDDKWAVRYIGQTDNLDRRLKEHLDFENEKNKCLGERLKKYNCGFCFAEINNQSERDGAEKALYKFYKPVCNDPNAIPSIPDIEINPR